MSQQLAALETRGLIRLAQLEPELEYLFRHGLVQDTIYGVMLKSDRRALHQAVGEALESLYPERIDALAPTLAYHFDQSGDQARALRYLTAAGDQAIAAFAIDEAILHHRRALELALAQSAPVEMLLHLFTALGRAYELDSQYGEALAVYEHMARVAQERGDERLELGSLTARATIYATPSSRSDPAQAMALMKQAGALAERIGDRATEARILWNLMLALTYNDGDLAEAVRAGEQSIAISRELDLREQLAFSLNDVSVAYSGLHDYENFDRVQEESAALWRELGNRPLLSDNLARRAHIEVIRGHYNLAIEYADEAVRISREIEHVWGESGSQLLIGRAYWELGRPSEALSHMDLAIRQADEVGYPGAMIITRADAAMLYGQLGDVTHGLAMIDAGFDRARAQASTFIAQIMPWMEAAAIRLRLMRGDVAGAAAAFDQSLENVQENMGFVPLGLVAKFTHAELLLAQADYAGARDLADEIVQHNLTDGTRIYYWDALCVKASALAALGDAAAADAALAEGQADAESRGARWSLWSILAARADMAAQAGRADDARALRGAALKIVQDIAADLGDRALRGSFLATSAVRALGD